MTLHRYATLTAAATYMLLIAGALVTSTDSGLAVPDWPLSYGMWLPPMVGGIRYEHSHRMIAAVVGLMILGLSVWVWRVESRAWIRRLAWLALGAVVAQALVGALTVKLLLPPPVSIVHACLAQTIFCLVVMVAVGTAPGSRQGPPALSGAAWPKTMRPWVLAAVSLAAVQLLLGAVIRHTGYAVPWHVAGGLGLWAAAAGLLTRAAQAPEADAITWRWSLRLLLLVSAQLILGALALARREAPVVVTLHVALGALILAQAVVLAWWHRRAPVDAPSRSRMRDYLELTKPRLTLLVAVTTGIGFWIGAGPGFDVTRLCLALVGIALAAGGANALNQVVERGPDAMMRRTQERPLPAGRLRVESARRFGMLLIVAGLALLGAGVNLLAGALAALGVASYLWAYTPLKRRSPLCTLVGAIPGAIPPMVGWAGARGSLGAEAWALFGLLFLWQLPHFLAIAILYREDYARAGFKMLPVLEPAGSAVGRQLILQGLMLLPVSLLPTLLGIAGERYFFGALALGACFVALCTRAARGYSAAACRQLFLASLVYLPSVLALLAFDKRLHA